MGIRRAFINFEAKVIIIAIVAIITIIIGLLKAWIIGMGTFVKGNRAFIIIMVVVMVIIIIKFEQLRRFVN